MTNDEHDDVNNSQALTHGDITKYRALVARISYLSQDRPDLKFAAMQVCCPMANPSASDLEWVKRIGRYVVVKPRAECKFTGSSEGAEWRGGKVTRRSVSAGVIDQERRTWFESMDQEAAGGALSTYESELYAVVKTASDEFGTQSVAKDLGIVCGLDPHLDATATDDVLGPPQGAG